ncbi:phytoene/squalene synthase family protein [Brevundimonas diminuta]|uniref:phytoene/squalene synthase family protein n=1 Tax=Brevundimonas diminuta TaxID=293 RepID=UPI001F5ABEA4|nr:phytoene/squalene synthase family protein [Brevundimonas diminuta]
MTDAVLDHSRQSMEQGSKSFAAAARLFPAAIRDDAWMLYSWCRHCDDEIDGQVLGHGAVGIDPVLAGERLDELRLRTAAALAGEPQTDPVFTAFQRVAMRHGIPADEAMDLLQGFEMDVVGRRYDTLEDTLDYAYHVAGVVGVMMARIMGVDDAPTLRRAQDLGLAFQLTNIARDVVEDAKGGRVYLPGAWLDEAGVPRDQVDQPQHRAAVARTAQRLVAAAEPFYASARWGLRDLNPRSAWAIATARGVYRSIGRHVSRAGVSAWDGRTSVDKAGKLMLLGRGGLIALWCKTLDAWREPPPRPALWTHV